MAEDDDKTSISSNRIKLPEFYRPNPHIWFSQTEMQFSLSQIKSENTKYLLAASTLPSDICESVLDIIENPPLENKYQTLKKALMERYSLSEEKRLEELFDKKELGDNKPSEVFRIMKRLAGDSFNDGIIRKLWLRRLPSIIQIPLISSDDKPITEMLSTADRMYETIDKSNICQTDSTPSTSRCSPTKNSELAELKQQINQLQRSFAKFATNRSRSQSPRQSSRFNRPTNDNKSPARRFQFCWYHHKYGTRAKRCVKPCSYDSPNTVSTTTHQSLNQ